MLKKLYYYDMKWMMKIIVIFLGLGLLFSVLGRLFEFFPNTIVFTIIVGICKGAALSMLISAIFNSVIRSWVRLIQNMYKDEAYLTHTIPVNTNQHYISKVLSSLTMIVVSFIVLLIGIIIMYFNETNLELLKQGLNIFSEALNTSILGFILLIIFAMILESILILFCGNYGIVYGNTYNKKRTQKILLYSLGAFFICNIITLIIMMVSAFISPSIYELVFEGTASITFELLKYTLWFAIFIYLIYIILLYYFTNKKLVNKEINID